LASARAELPLTQAFFAFVCARMPEVQAIWLAGGRHLELGCGIGGTLLGPLLLFPQLKGVGVEIDPTIVDHIRRRAAQLRLTERAEIRLGDARKVDEFASYDTVLWSQTFFPRETRHDTLFAIHRALKAGGYLLMPILYGDPPQSLESLREPGGRMFTLNRLVYGHWGVPLMGSQDLQSEAAESGFATVREVQTPVARYLLVQKATA
jgi:cyclopropane fatty-acyl-phospholipid synthase-like methyltransferase